MDEYYKAGTAVQQNGPRKVELNDAVSAVATAVVGTRAHFDETAVDAICRLEDWSDLRAIYQRG